ncbi:MAG: TIGR03435 family protein [Chitinophagaceae bacterium]
MKKIMMALSCMLIAEIGITQQLTIGDKVPDLNFPDCIVPNNNKMIVKNISLSNFKNKIILLDFWATWCGPCISAMKKYESFQKKYKDKLQIIAITHESVKRIQKFSENRPTSLLIAIDSSETLRKYFMYRTIPHVILIDGNGIIRAITHSDEITEQVIEKISKGESISLSYKKDNTDFDIEADYFSVDSTTKEAFTLQSGIAGVGTFSKIGKGIFKDRRLSLHNFLIDGLYRMAYNVSFFRVVYEMDKKEFDYENPKNKYCLDIIIPSADKNALYTYLQKKLPEYFDVKTRLEKRKITVHILKRNNEPLTFKPSSVVNDTYAASSNHFTGEGVGMKNIAEYMESFGILGTPVLDETGINTRYDIHLEWEPEKKGSFREAFSKAGLVVEKVEREIEVLVIYK